MKRTALVLAALSFFTTIFAGPYLYISHYGFKKISVFDTAMNKVVGEIPLQFSARAMRLSPDEKYLYFVSADTNSMYRIITKNSTLDKDFVNVGYMPMAFEITNDGKRAYTANGKSNNVTVVDLEKFDVTLDPIQLTGSPRAVAISEDDSKVYLPLAGNAGIAVIRTSDNKFIKVIPTGADPWGAIVKGNFLYVTNEGLASISVIDTRNDTLVNEVVSSDTPRGIAYCGGNLYVSVMNGMDIFEAAHFTKPASVGFDYVVYDAINGKTPSGNKIYVAGYDKAAAMGKIAVVDPQANEIVTEVDVQGWPYFLEMRRDRPTATPSFTPVNTSTVVPSQTQTHTSTPTGTFTPTFTNTSTSTATPTPTSTPVPKKKKKAAPTATPTVSLLSETLKGKVILNGSPAPNVTVKALNKHSNQVYEAVTNSNGEFEMKTLPIGGYMITTDATYIVEKAFALTINKGGNNYIEMNVSKR
jgi:DNA-binding beta-propeller fold protein YncE